MVTPLSKNLIFPIFGEFYGNKLIRLLSDCCQPHILIKACATCAGLDPSGVQQYKVTASATYNMNVTGTTSLFGYFSNQPIPDWTNVTNDTLDNLNLNEGTIFLGPITANVPIVSANLITKNMNPGTAYAMVTDNRGNYSNMLVINFPDCGKTAASSATPAQSSKSQPTG